MTGAEWDETKDTCPACGFAVDLEELEMNDGVCDDCDVYPAKEAENND